jgi:hypothetical protein
MHGLIESGAIRRTAQSAEAAPVPPAAAGVAKANGAAHAGSPNFA